MKIKFSLILMMLTSFIVIKSFSQNVGVGIVTPTDAKLQVVSADNASAGMFSNGTTGISLLHELGRPGIGLNMYLNSGYKFKGNGFGGLFYYLPTTGSLTYYSSTATGLAGGLPAFSPIMTMQADGNVGIGITTPTEAKLQVHEPAGNTQFIAAAGPNLPGISNFVPISSPSVGFNARYQGSYKFMGTGYGSFFQYTPSLGRMSYWYSSTSGAADGAMTSFHSFSIDSSGQMGIGTQSPKAPLHVTGNVVFGSASRVPATGYKVSIDGKVICEELKVQISTSWPDYVFEPTYNMPRLAELQKQVLQQKHLPGIPSAAEVKENKGIEVGDMQQKLLEKVEELYLYVFKINEENLKLREEVNALKKQVTDK